VSATKFSIASITFSLAGLFSVLLIWVAGSPQFGAFSRVSYLVGGFETLLGIGIFFLGVSATLLLFSPAKNISEKVAPLVVLVVSFLPLLLFSLVLFAKLLQSAS